MRFFNLIGQEKIAWSLRRLHCPVDRAALVLEVGSGGNPYPRANVLLDAYQETRERHWEPLVHDRPTVLAFGEKLPFRDKAFDFVIAAHVLEHTPDPQKFLAELQRVAYAGYIETPDAFMERINPYKDHRLEVTLRDDGLVIRKKLAWVVDAELVELYEQRAKLIVSQKLIPEHPADFHIRYYWKDKITFLVINSAVDSSWNPVDIQRPNELVDGIKQTVRTGLLTFIRLIFSQSRRNKHIDLLELLLCPKCRGEKLVRQKDQIVCEGCKTSYGVKQNVFVMQPREPGMLEQ